MKVESYLLDAANACRERRIAFALYCKPFSEECVFLADAGASEARGGREFFAVGFNGHFADRFVIRDSVGITQIYEYPIDPISGNGKVSVNPSRADYIAEVTSLISELHASGGKCVISRIFPMSFDRNDFYDGVNDLFASNANAFRALFYTPDAGCWIVASPEVLADISENNFKTMSLAGTRPAGSSSSWDEKNIREQRIVTDTVEADLKDLGIKPELSRTFTLRSNLVEHLCTNINATLSENISIGMLLDKLSPTPAIAGFPRDESLTQIGKFEDFTRKLYGGYFGIAEGKNLLAHVTLRCAEILDETLAVYAGSGITPDSAAAEEWEEINAKARQFSNCFTN